MSSTIDALSGIDSSSAQTKTSGSNNELGYDAFLQLLVAEMKYQDPLEPTSNTEYMSQLAQFSTLSSIQELNSSFGNSNALSLVGKYVLINTGQDSTTGETTYAKGYVDYVTISNGKALLYINDKYYNYEDLDSVVDEEYLKLLAQQESGVTGEDNTTTDEDGTVTDKDDTTTDKDNAVTDKNDTITDEDETLTDKDDTTQVD